jgi:hypothetical protein
MGGLDCTEAGTVGSVVKVTISNETLADCILRLLGLRGEVPYKNEDTCIYHDHGNKTPCYRTMF